MRDAVGRIQTMLVLGGGSEIALATVEALLERGPLTAILAARRPDELEAGSLERRGATIECVRFDATETNEHQRLVETIFDTHEDVDLVLLAFGILGDQDEAEAEPTVAVRIADTNFTGAVSLLTIVAGRMKRQGHGAIVVLSSVAAERARRSNYVYGASKAGLDAFAQGLQLAVAGSGVHVLLVRPGFVHSKMTRGRKEAPFSVRPRQVAQAILRALDRGDDVIWVPPVLRAVMFVVKRLPRRVLQRL